LSPHKRKKKNKITKRNIILFFVGKKNPQQGRKNNKEIKHFFHSLASTVC
tara:strand:+ start:771 stop:920 length:150 start_codon:yes stop_codon:yes gene_type:complete